MAIKCPSCQQWFDDMESYQNHTCSSKTYGGSGDLRHAREDVEKGGTGGGRP